MTPLAIVTGVGPGTFTELVRRFVQSGALVAVIVRDTARRDALAAGSVPVSFVVEAGVSPV